ncbi:MAG: tRNA uridine-5-carboxymethylaminomethyl(34) synthesis GTPase MnmE [Spirochaetales bacterium]|nr:tRNA uridine-5-carboxymethylaminomethyl(34) synthesis GTPase MnmE [Spirochaetales bacterium]
MKRLSSILRCVEDRLYDTKDIIYALATPWGSAALAIIRISGEHSIELLSSVFSRPRALCDADSHTLVHGFLVDPENKQHVDEVVVSVFRDKRGYTGEESAEITLHGSLVVVREALQLLGRIGMRSASPGEFSFRAFMHGRIDLTQAEAIHEIISARTSVGKAMAMNKLEGALFDRIEELKQRVLKVVSSVEVQLDYAEDEIGGDIEFPFEEVTFIHKRLDELAYSYKIGRLYAKGAKIVIAGSTNAGKSTLFNLMLRQERSIVSDIHGTTRDFIEAELSIAGIPVLLYDTAGFREASSDSVEVEGMHRTGRLLDQADVILLMLDGTDAQRAKATSSTLIQDSRCIVVWNKTDKALSLEIPEGSIAISAKTGFGMDTLLNEIAKRLLNDTTTTGQDQIVIESQRQYDALTRASAALKKAFEFAEDEVPLDIIAIELDEALDALGSLTGDVASEEILEQIFSGFCVGK